MKAYYLYLIISNIFLQEYDWAGVEESFSRGIDILKLEDPPTHLQLLPDEDDDPNMELSASPRKRRRHAPTKPKNVEVCDIACLDPIGERTISVCTNCFYRGHIHSSTLVCPYHIVQMAIKTSENKKRSRRDDRCIKAVRLLQTMYALMEQHGDTRRDRDESSLSDILRDLEEINPENGESLLS